MDRTAWSLVAANAVTLAMAWFQGWSAASLMLIYWCQSVLIGVSNVFRMLALKNFFSTMEMNHQPIAPTKSGQRKLAAFFALHYGMFHAFYLLFIVVLFFGRPLPLGILFWICVASFAINQILAFRDARDQDRQGWVDIGTLFFSPYLRIIPMHLTIVVGPFLVVFLHLQTIFGGVLGNGILPLFCVLKTLADVWTHGLERRQLRGPAPNPGLTPPAPVAAQTAHEPDELKDAP
jgi:hypothetical protein